MNEEFSYVDEVGIITLVDPNKINVNPNQVNSVPDYENMHIFAELVAKRRGRTVIMGGSGINNSLRGSNEDEVSINMMGINQDPNNPSKGNFTTNWHDSEEGGSGQIETFGITDIKIKTNTSFIPQISIEFTDIRGYSFFNNKNSPYRILFDFPPPIFTLSVKGYYGKGLKYLLHLVKYSSSFNANNGNFIINAEFIGITYAPLTDVLFRYVLNFPLLNEEYRGYNPDSSLEPKNTYDFILKLKSLNHTIKTFLSTELSKVEYESSVEQLDRFSRAKTRLINYDSDSSILTQKIGKTYLFINTKIDNPPFITVDRGGIEVIKNFGIYENYLKSFGENSIPTSSSLTKRLYFGFKVKGVGYTGTGEDRRFIGSPDVSFQQEKIKGYVERFINELAVIPEKEFTVQTLETKYNLEENRETEKDNNYYIVDLTEFYVEFFKEKNIQERRRETSANELNEKINSMIRRELGMLPTIYNVFKLIMDDVDYFFTKLRETSMYAEDKHNDILIKLMNPSDEERYEDSIEHIYSFPLLIKEEEIRGDCTEVREVRSSPTSIEKTHSYRFPEMDLVDGFIDTFKLQNKELFLINQRAEQGAYGENIWVPILPPDSITLSSAISPYFRILRRTGGATEYIYSILLERYYLLTQYGFTLSFGMERFNNLLEFYADAEASNLAQAVLDLGIFDLLKMQSEQFRGNVQDFYNYVESNLGELYDFTEKEFFKLSPQDTFDIVKNKKSDDFIGLVVLNDVVSERGDESIEGNGPVFEYLNKYNKNFLRKIKGWFGRSEFEETFTFTNENLFYVKDSENIGASRFIYDITKRTNIIRTNNIVYFYDGHSLGTQKYPPYKRIKRIWDRGRTNQPDYFKVLDYIRVSGNYGFVNLGIEERNNIVEKDIESPSTGMLYYNFNLFAEHIRLLKINGYGGVYNKIIDSNHSEYNLDLSTIMIISLFGNIETPFNNYFNETIFSRPIITEIPKIVLYYLGFIVDIIERNGVDNIYDFLKGELGKQLYDKNFSKSFNKNIRPVDSLIFNGGLRIVADIYDVQNNLSKRDRDYLRGYYRIFKNTNEMNLRILPVYKQMINEEPVSEDNRRIFIETLMERVNLVIYSEQTFYNGDVKPEGEYKPIKTLVGNKKEQTNTYFNLFFQKLYDYLENEEKNIQEKEKELNLKIGDEDIRTQTYYSFKNINDRWLSGIDGVFKTSNMKGYPFNETNDKNGDRALINSFSFVDRTMSPIGDTIINPEILLDIMEDPNVSIFTVISQILSTNGFEFFPLQNFMTHKRGDWIDSFKIDTSGKIEHTPVFVCMYLGGTSSYPTGISNHSGGQFKDDGIIDLINEPPVDFTRGECNDSGSSTIEDTLDNQKNTNPNFPWRQIRAFRVRFGQQNQSMFNDIKIEGNEFPETNESIQILSRIAGDNKQQAPIPKGQNLYNVYENRAYSSTITSLGNMMIQPTQYYQLENIPLFDGAYIILNVEHNIKPNHATTTFEGTKILKFPIPRVQEPYAVFGFEGGTSKIGDPDRTEITPGSPVEMFEGTLLPPVNPLIIRSDRGGDGKYGARRDGGSRSHTGIDFVTTIGQNVVAPISGRVVNHMNKGNKYPMLTLTPENPRNDFDFILIIYVDPPTGITMGTSRYVEEGEVIGKAIDLKTIGYSSIVGNHIHVALAKYKDNIRIDPTPFFGNPPVQPVA